MLECVIAKCHIVRPSVRPSQSWSTSKRFKKSKYVRRQTTERWF